VSQAHPGIAVTIVGGQSLCLFLTLPLVPAVYVTLAALEQSSLGRRLAARAGRLASAVRRVRPASAE
jgi:hypothetical protein